MKLLVALMALVAGTPAVAQATDCPAARQPYASKTILVDLLIDPPATAVLEREAPSMLRGFGPNGGIPHNFATIMTPAWLLRMRPEGAATAAKLDVALRQLPITAVATLARCARYENVRPELPGPDMPGPHSVSKQNRNQTLVEFFEVIDGHIHRILAVMYDMDDPVVTTTGW